MNQSERRAFPRFKIEQMIEYRIGGEAFTHCRAVDFSLGGFRCETDAPMETGARLFVMFRPGDQGDPISAEAVVLHAVPSGKKFLNGCQFTDLDAENQKRLAFVLSQKPGGKTP